MLGLYISLVITSYALFSEDSTRLTKSLSCQTSSPSCNQSRDRRTSCRPSPSRRQAALKSRNPTTSSRWSHFYLIGSSRAAGTFYFGSRSANSWRRIGSGSRRLCAWRPKRRQPATFQQFVSLLTISRLNVCTRLCFSRPTTSVRWDSSSWTSTENATPLRFNRSLLIYYLF